MFSHFFIIWSIYHHHLLRCIYLQVREYNVALLYLKISTIVKLFVQVLKKNSAGQQWIPHEPYSDDLGSVLLFGSRRFSATVLHRIHKQCINMQYQSSNTDGVWLCEPTEQDHPDICIKLCTCATRVCKKCYGSIKRRIHSYNGCCSLVQSACTSSSHFYSKWNDHSIPTMKRNEIEWALKTFWHYLWTLPTKALCDFIF